MLLTLAALLIIVWFVSVLLNITTSGLIHLALILGIIVLVMHILGSRR